ncbi:unnamed protein product [Porites evermanni]|uniref:Myb-like domain-containing protein n=1 Tax=Porites evermanni TaxID=104178 RepID=A0ABN8MII3_9CNID|nr:unnamed protein product [Porites evermanni]
MAASDDQVQKSKPMEWSEEHDVLFLREMLARNVFGTKKGSPAPVRERWKKVQQKDGRGREGKWDFCERVNGEGITDRGVEREDTIQAKAESASKQQLKDNETAEDIKKKAVESVKETKKRNSDEGGASPKRRKPRRAEPPELCAKQQEQESQQQMMKAMMLQQQQMNTAFLCVVKKRLDK